MSRSEHGPPLRLVGGKGGVGKTTVACGRAVHLARAGWRVVLLSTDPAHSVGDVLGPAHEPGLTVEPLDAEARVEAFRDTHRATLSEIALRGTVLAGEHVEALLDLGLPGQDELMAVLRIHALLEDPEVDRVVVDTAPTGHTLRLLDGPDLLLDWIGALDTLVEKHRFMRARFTGSDAPDHLDAFLSRHRELAEKLRDRLRDPAFTAFTVVTLAEPVVLDETRSLVRGLQDRGIPVDHVVVNRWTGARVNLSGLPEPLALDEVEEEPLGPDGVALLWAHRHPPSSPVERLPTAPAPQAAAPLPEAILDTPWIWVAGKGGVGKTTLACALAVALADARPAGRTLLVSTDPAHSLAAVLGVPVGPEPTRIADGLEALALDAASELETLKALHAEDVQALFGATLQGVDPVFDRAVLERLLDLAPPGIDEIMALARAARVAARGPWEQVVVDTAPTGHFLRLLGLPEVLAGWIKWAFGVLLDHRDVLRLPRLSAELVTRSRELKAFRARLADPEQSSLLVVRRPTAVTRAETDALLAAAAAHTLPARAVVDNLAPPGIAARTDAAPPVIPVPRGAPPVGLDALRILGASLYPPAAHREAG